MLVRLSPAVRIIPPSDVTGDEWIAEHVLERRRYKLSPAAAAALVASCRPQEPEQLATRLVECGNGFDAPVGYWQDLIDALVQRGLVIDASQTATDPRLTWLIAIRKSWSRFGWREAAEYHTLTFDYPCVDYSRAVGILADRSRMGGYQSVEPDTDRFKLEYLMCPNVPLPEPAETMGSATARAVWTAPLRPAPVDISALSRLVSLAFGATGCIVPRTQAAPLLRRSSPSGGARHPSEGYVITREVSGIASGWYHITMRPFGLRKLEGLPTDEDNLRRLFPMALRRFPFEVKALIVVTSRFERNMYRYREPRTFRTVHMDAGHIAGTVRIAARSLGLMTGICCGDLATDIEEMLGLDGLQEGYMLTIAVADGADESPGQSMSASVSRRIDRDVFGSVV